MVLLNIQTGFTFLSSTLQGANLATAMDEFEYSIIGLANVNNFFDALEVHHALVKKNKSMVLGMTLRTANPSGEICDGVVYATNEKGVTSLKQLTRFVSKPTIFIAQSELHNWTPQGIAFVEPSLHGYIASLKSTDPKTTVTHYFETLKAQYDSVYLGLNKATNEEDKQWNQWLRDWAHRHQIQVLAFPRIRAISPSDIELIDVLTAIKNGSNTQVSTHLSECLMQVSSVDFLPEEWKLTERLAKQWIWRPLKSGKRPMPYKVTQEGIDLPTYLRALSLKGLERRLRTNTLPKVYLDRLDHELSVITKLGYSDYFLVVYDYVRFAKTNQIIVGPGRGSGAASLVCYTLGITDVDPLKYGLLFERFLNPERITMPDIDVDFQDDRRQEVITYLKDKYGQDHFAHVVAFTRFQAKSALRDVGKALAIPLAEIDRIAKMVPSTMSLKEFHQSDVGFRAAMEVSLPYQKWFHYASSIEDLPRQTTLHAAGVVVSLDPISSCTPIYAHEPTVQTTQYDMTYIEEDGLLKMDILGLKNLSIIDYTIKSIRLSTGSDFSLSDIPLNDKRVYELIRSGRTSGIFQLESGGIINEAIKVVKPENFEDVVSILALFRPGPKEFIPTYARRKHGVESFTIQPHVLEPILKPTYGIIVYQEQIMQIVQVMAGFSLGKADVVRRAISKKKESELITIRSEFLQGSLQKGHSEQDANAVFDLIMRFADYGFARAHAVAYAIVSVQMAYLKTYYPAPFYASVLNTFALGANDAKLVDYLREIKRIGIHINRPSVIHSQSVFTVTKEGALQYALTAINGVGTALVDAIILNRQQGVFLNFFDFVARIPAKLRQTKSITALIDAGALDEFGLARATLLANVTSATTYALIRDQSSHGLLTQPLDPPRLIEATANQEQTLDREFAVLGTYLSGFPLELRRPELSAQGYKTIEEIKGLRQGSVKLVVYIKANRIIKTKKGDPMSLLDIIDETDLMTIPIFPALFTSVQPHLKSGSFVIIEGKMEERDGEATLLAFRLFPESRTTK